MALRTRSVTMLIAALAVAAALAPTGNAGLRADAPKVFPTLFVVYTMNCTFHIEDDDGRTVSAIQPGTYQVEVSTPVMFKLVVPGGEAVDRPAANDFTGCKGWVQFQLTGPGVDLFTTLDSGCDAYLTLPAITFKPGATFVAQDLNQPSVTRMTFSTLGAGEAQSRVGPYTATSDKGQTFAERLGETVRTALQAELSGTLTSGGRPTLKLKGKAVSNLHAGRYRFVINDRDPKRSFTIKALDGKSTALTGVAYVGTKEKIVTLGPGRWMYSSGLGKVYYFRVSD